MANYIVINEVKYEIFDFKLVENESYVFRRDILNNVCKYTGRMHKIIHDMEINESYLIINDVFQYGVCLHMHFKEDMLKIRYDSCFDYTEIYLNFI